MRSDIIEIRSIIIIFLLIIIMNWGISSSNFNYETSSNCIQGSIERKNISIPSFVFSSTTKTKFHNLVSHTPIFIDGNHNFHNQASTEGWDLQGSRSGSHLAPYVILGMKSRIIQSI